MTPAVVDPSGLDETVRRVRSRLDAMKVAPPDVLFLLATGAGALAEHLEDGHEIELGDIDECPHPWRGELFFSGRLGTINAWAIDDVGGDPRDAHVAPDGPESAAWPAWVGGFPVWLAASAGAEILVHASAGTALATSDAGSNRAIGSYALVRDHVNLSGRSPLTALGESRLGPLFPDQSRLHHIGLRSAAARVAERLGLSVFEAIAACTSGPALETPAERTMFARIGADVVVQSLAAPLIAGAHAGLATLALVAVSDTADAEASVGGNAGVTDVSDLVQHATDSAPELEQLLLELVPELARATLVLRSDSGL